MPLQRLEPEVKRYDLGTVRLWQDELAEIVRLVRQLPAVDVEIRSDGYNLTDVQADLPEIGPRVSYFMVTANRAGGNSDSTTVTVWLSKGACQIKATDPDLTTIGLIQGIESIASTCRRLPLWLPASFFAIPTSSTNKFFDTLEVARSDSLDLGDMFELPTLGSSFPGLGFLILVFAVVGCVIFGTGSIQHLVHIHGKPWAPWPLSIGMAITSLVLLVAFLGGQVRSRSLLFTATRREAPTFWQRKGSDIVINVIVGLIFFLLGLLIAHL